MATDILSLAVTQALLYAITPYNYTEQPTVNWTEINRISYWGPSGTENNQDTSIRPANITFSDELIADLRQRLTLSASKPFTPHLQNVAFQYGFNPDLITYFINYWNNTYDFRGREASVFNRFPMFRTTVQGLDIFFLRVNPRPQNTTKEVIPLLLLHGWPGSWLEFYDVIPLLTAESADRDYVIDLIIPSLPGFGFSSAAAHPNLDTASIAVVFRNFMRRLGYRKWYVQGGDFGGLTAQDMVTLYPTEVLGMHSNFPVLLSPVAILLQIVGTLYPPMVVSNATYSWMYPITDRFRILMTATGYMHLQVTRPDTMGIALTDSPTALMAYIFEKYATANNKSNIAALDGGLRNQYRPDYLIDIMMYFWTRHTIQSAMRLYSETFNVRHASLRMDEIPTYTPVYLMQPVDEFVYQSATILSLKFKNMVGVEVSNVGGHFLAQGQPAVFARSVHRGLNAIRDWHRQNGTDTNVRLTA